MTKKKEEDFIIDTRKHDLQVTNSEEFMIKVLRFIVKYKYYIVCLFIGIMLGIVFE